MQWSYPAGCVQWPGSRVSVACTIVFFQNQHTPLAQVVEGFDFEADLHMSSLVVDECTSRLGVHRDPASPMPALVAGTTVYSLGADGKEVRVASGGRLFQADGLFDLSYGPYDAVLMDGNLAHGVTCLAALKGRGHLQGRAPLRRSSLIVFNRFIILIVTIVLAFVINGNFHSIIFLVIVYSPTHWLLPTRMTTTAEGRRATVSPLTT